MAEIVAVDAGGRYPSQWRWNCSADV